MNVEDAEEYTQALGQVVAGGWRQVALGERLGVPRALGLSTRDWVEGRLGGYVRLAIPERREAVAELTSGEEPMSNRKAAEVLGVDESTVRADLAPAGFPAPEPEPLPLPQVTDVQVEETEASAGNPAPEPELAQPPRTPSRRALPDQFFDAAFDLTKAVERVRRIAADDRFTQNAGKVAAKHRHDLLRTRDLLQEVIDRLPQPDPEDTQ